MQTNKNAVVTTAATIISQLPELNGVPQKVLEGKIKDLIKYASSVMPTARIPETMSVKEASDALGCHRNTIYRHTGDGTLKSKLIGGNRRIYKSSVLELFDILDSASKIVADEPED